MKLSSSSNNWLVWALLSALFAGATAILAKLGVAGVNSNLATAIRTTVVLVLTWIIAFAGSQPSAMFELPRRTWLFLVLSGLATGLTWLCYFRALQLGEVAKVAPVDKLSLVFVLIFAAIFLKEPVGWQQWIGVVLILAGVLALSWK